MEWAVDVKNLVLFTERGQFGTLARMLQEDPPPKAVKVTMSRKVPLVGEELIAYEEEQSCLKKEKALKASLVKEESKASHVPDINSSDSMVIDTNNKHPSLDGLGQHGKGYRGILMDGFVPSSTSVATMFPFYEDTADWDDFGEVINPDDYVIKDEDMDQAAMCIGGDMDGKLDEGFANLIPETTSSKVISNELTVQLKSSLIYMDYEGRSGGRSVKLIFAHVAPLKFVLVHGSVEATEHLNPLLHAIVCKTRHLLGSLLHTPSFSTRNQNMIKGGSFSLLRGLEN